MKGYIKQDYESGYDASQSLFRSLTPDLKTSVLTPSSETQYAKNTELECKNEINEQDD